MGGIRVGVDNFARAETDRMFGALQADAAGVNVLKHNREPTPVDHQPVIRMNRDTLYSIAVADISEGATLTIPGRRRSVRLGDGRQPGSLHQPDLPSARRAPTVRRRVRYAVGRACGESARRPGRCRRRRSRCDDGRPNCLPIMAGWNYTVRLYRPRREILDRSWKFPGIDGS